MWVMVCIAIAFAILAYKAQWDDKAILWCLFLSTTY